MILHNGNFVKVMFLLICVFFGTIIGWQIYYDRTEYVDELLTALIVFFTLVGRSVVEVYREHSGVEPER